MHIGATLCVAVHGDLSPSLFSKWDLQFFKQIFQRVLRGPWKREARSICHICYTANPALTANLSHRDLGRRRTERRINSEWAALSHGYWTYCWRVASASTRACVRAGGGHFSTCCNKDAVMWNVWLFLRH